MVAERTRRLSSACSSGVRTILACSSALPRTLDDTGSVAKIGEMLIREQQTSSASTWTDSRSEATQACIVSLKYPLPAISSSACASIRPSVRGGKCCAPAGRESRQPRSDRRSARATCPPASGWSPALSGDRKGRRAAPACRAVTPPPLCGSKHDALRRLQPPELHITTHSRFSQAGDRWPARGKSQKGGFSYGQEGDAQGNGIR